MTTLSLARRENHLWQEADVLLGLIDTGDHSTTLFSRLLPLSASLMSMKRGRTVVGLSRCGSRRWSGGTQVRLPSRDPTAHIREPSGYGCQYGFRSPSYFSQMAQFSEHYPVPMDAVS